MEIAKQAIADVVAKLYSYYDISVEIGNTLVAVYADSNKAINEFESRLVAATLEGGQWSGDVAILLDEMVNFIDHRSRFEPLLVTDDSGAWVAHYTNLTLI